MTLNMYVPDHISLGWWFEIVEACVSGPWVKVYLLRIKENNKKKLASSVIIYIYPVKVCNPSKTWL